MADDATVSRAEAVGLRAVKRSEGIDALRRVLAEPDPLAVAAVVPIVWSRFLAKSFAGKVPPFLSAFARYLPHQAVPIPDGGQRWDVPTDGAGISRAVPTAPTTPSELAQLVLGAAARSLGTAPSAETDDLVEAGMDCAQNPVECPCATHSYSFPPPILWPPPSLSTQLFRGLSSGTRCRRRSEAPACPPHCFLSTRRRRRWPCSSPSTSRCTHQRCSTPLSA